MQTRLTLGEIGVDVIRKGIKNVHLSVHPPTGRVRIAAPEHMSLDTIRVFAIAKLPWIKRQQRKMLEQERETLLEYIPRESHYLWGKRYLLQVIEDEVPPFVELKHGRLVLHVRPGTGAARRRVVVEQWHRSQLRNAVRKIVAKWEPLLGVNVRRVFIQRMKTKWGSCNPRAGSIRLNTDLARKPRDCLEYIVVHEMVHLIEPTHSAHFVELMNQFMPRWQLRRDSLNRLPVRHEEWDY